MEVMENKLFVMTTRFLFLLEPLHTRVLTMLGLACASTFLNMLIPRSNVYSSLYGPNIVK